MKYLYLTAGHAMDTTRTRYKLTMDVLSTERTCNKCNVVLYNEL